MHLAEYSRLSISPMKTSAGFLHSSKLKLFLGIILVCLLFAYIYTYNGSKPLKTFDYSHIGEFPPLKLKLTKPFVSCRDVDSFYEIFNNQTCSKASRTTGKLNITLAPGSQSLNTYDYNHFDELVYRKLKHYDSFGSSRDVVDHLVEILNNQTCSKAPRTKEKLSVALVSEKKCSAPFLSINDDGRLGNNICQYMSLLYFRKRFGVRVITSLKMRKTLEQIFEKISTPVSLSTCFKTKGQKFENPFKTMVEVFENATAKNISFNKLIPQRFTQLRQSNFISDYPCRLDYLLRYREELKSELHIRNALQIEARKVIQETLANVNRSIENVTLISVHARRTDYLNFTKSRSIKFPSSSFYKKAMDFYRRRIPNAIFVVLSDDLKWVQENLKGDDLLYPGTSNIQSPFLDYAILNYCHHHIYGLGTFGATSAFLGSGSIAYYANEKVAKLFAEAVSSLKCWSSQAFLPMTD